MKIINHLTLFLVLGLLAFHAAAGPVITSQPVGASVGVGQASSTSVTVSGTAPFAYEWIKDGVLLPGQTNSTLNFASFQLTNSGVYEVVVSNSSGITISLPAPLSLTNALLRGWGYNSDGALGVGTLNNTNLPEVVATNVVAEAAGGDHSLYVTADGTLWAMGDNSGGELGVGTYNSTNRPEVVATNVMAVAAGIGFSLFVTADGKLWDMGEDFQGELGLGNLPLPYTNGPAFVASNVVAVAAGNTYSLFVTADGKLWAMGDNDYGQLGDGTFTETNRPEAVASNVVAVAAGESHSLFVTADGKLWAMGQNAYGQLGDGTLNNSTNRPETVATNVVTVAAGQDHSLFVTADGKLWAMGYNYFGQLGDGAYNNTNRPEAVMPGVTTVAAGMNYSLFVKTDGSLWSMGDNGYGELGVGPTTYPENAVPVPVRGGGLAASSLARGPEADHCLALAGIVPVVNALASQTVNAGQPFSFSAVVAAGDGPFTYQWQLNQMNISGANSATYSVASSGANVAGTYTVVVTGLAGSAGASGNLTNLVALASASGQPGSTNTATDYGFAANETVSLYYNGALLGTTNANGSGTVNAVFTTPLTNPAGIYIVTLTGQASLFTNTAAFNQNTPLVTLADTTGYPGSANIATGYGFGANEFVSLSYNSLFLGTTNANAGGTVNALFTTPLTTTNGTYTVNLAGIPGGSAVFIQNTPSATLASTAGAPGSANTATGSGFAPHETVNLYFNGVLLGTTNADGGGNVNAIFTTPTSNPGGTYVVILAGQTSGLAELAVFNQNAPFVSLASTAGAPGSANTANGYGFAANGTVSLYYNGVFLGYTSADGTGAVHKNFTTPLTNPEGSYNVSLTNVVNSPAGGSAVFNQNTPLVTLASSTGAPGSANTAFGYGFAAGETVNLYYAGASLGSAAADSTGAVNAPYITPGTNPDGNINVSLTGQTSSLTGSAVFIQKTPLAITVQPAGVVVAAGLPASLSVTAAGTAPLAYQWLKDGVLLPGQTGSTLSFSALQLTNSGTYQVVVSNNEGLAISFPAPLSISNALLHAWGYDGYGELGDGNYNYNGVDLPELVTSNVVTEAAGDYHSLFVTADGKLWAMGDDYYGELGDGRYFTYANQPEVVATNVVAVAAGASDSLFVKADGTLWAMGQNIYGKLGLGTPGITNRPAMVASNVVAVAAGYYHSLFVKADGTLWAMGYNADGELGVGTLPYSFPATNQPVMVTSNVVAVAAGGFYSLFVKADGTLWGTGANYDGALGDGTDNSTNFPELIATNVVTVAAGDAHSLFVTTDGKLWGMGYNDYGQLGDGTYNNASRPEVVATNVVAVTAGNAQSLFVTADGTLWGMGGNEAGQLGDGLYNGQYYGEEPGTNQPVMVNGGGMTTASLARGPEAQHSLAVAAVLPFVENLADQTVYVGQGFQFYPYFYGGDYSPVTYQWQLNGTNIPGATEFYYYSDDASTNDAGVYTLVLTGTYGSSSTIVTLTVLLPPTPPVISQQPVGASVAGIGQPASVSVAVSGSAPLTYEWIKDGVLLPGQTNSTLNFCSFQFTNSGAYQSVISNALGFVISQPALVCLTNAPLRGWGNDADNQLGDYGEYYYNGFYFDYVPELVMNNVVAEAVGGEHSLFVTADGTLWTMGNNADGELGENYSTTVYYPQSVTTTTNVVAVAAGESHSLFITADGTLWAMGYDADGELGDGGGGDEYFPEPVATNVVAVAAGGYHSMYLTADGTLWVMGNNADGQLGDGTTNSAGLPEAVATNVVTIAGGEYHSLFVTADGNLWAMGDNSAGELGDGAMELYTNLPEMIASNVVAVAAGGYPSINGIGGYHSLYVTADANLWAMGYNGDGELGDGTMNNATLPEVIQPGVVAVSAGAAHSLFITGDGNLWSMGDNTFGELGYYYGDGSYYPVQVNGGGLVTASLAKGEGAFHALALAGMSPEAYVPWLTVSSGQPFTNTAIVYGGDGPFTYQWQFSGTNIIGATNYTYGVASATTNNAGTYAVTVTGAYGTTTTYAILTVISVPPVITALTLQTNPGGPGEVLTFAVSPSQSYQVLFSTDLINWTSLGTYYPNGSGQLVVTDTGATTATRFYRLEQ